MDDQLQMQLDEMRDAILAASMANTKFWARILAQLVARGVLRPAEILAAMEEQRQATDVFRHVRWTQPRIEALALMHLGLALSQAVEGIGYSNPGTRSWRADPDDPQFPEPYWRMRPESD